MVKSYMGKLRCPICLWSYREVHLIEDEGSLRCPDCSFYGSRQDVERLYAMLGPAGFAKAKAKTETRRKQKLAD